MRTVYTGSSSIFFQAVLTGSQFIISNYIVFLSLKIDFVLANSADPLILFFKVCKNTNKQSVSTIKGK